VVHMCDYFNKQVQFSNNDQPIGDKSGWGLARAVFFKVVVIICLFIKLLLFLDLDVRHQLAYSS
jgi:hypothetical protein